MFMFIILYQVYPYYVVKIIITQQYFPPPKHHTCTSTSHIVLLQKQNKRIVVQLTSGIIMSVALNYCRKVDRFIISCCVLLFSTLPAPSTSSKMENLYISTCVIPFNLKTIEIRTNCFFPSTRHDDFNIFCRDKWQSEILFLHRFQNLNKLKTQVLFQINICIFSLVEMACVL